MLSALARQFFRLLGWKLIGDIPPHIQRAVIVVAPHTSNWDGFYGLLFCLVKKLKIRFVIKKEVMFFPLGLLLKRLGAVPIDRKKKSMGTVRQIATMLQQHPLMVIITPEGTRSRVARWKLGFYHIAQQAGVPIVLGFLDYAQKHIGFGPIIEPTGNLHNDLQQIQLFYQDKVGRYPDQRVKVI